MIVTVKNLTKKIYKDISLVLLIVVSSSGSSIADEDSFFEDGIFDKILSDYRNFYTEQRLTRIASTSLEMATIANSSIDQNIYNWYQDKVRSSSTDDISRIAKLAGEGKYLLPLSILASQVLHFYPESKIGSWGTDVARSYTLGLPFIWSGQYLTGASRPTESRGSYWRPFEDNNGISGHAFIGAVPFLVMANKTDNTKLRYLAYAASGLTAWSRFNDGAHYISQAVLGWYIAYETVSAVTETNINNKRINYAIQPLVGEDYIGINVRFTFP